MILDTNALSAWAEGLPQVESALRTAGRVVVPVVVLGEYYFGIRQSRQQERYKEWLRRCLPLIEIASITHSTASVYAEMRLALKRSGEPIPSNDVWIAALACQHQLPLLSNDRHFDFVGGLRRIRF